MTHSYNLSLVLPFYNEEKNVEKVIISTVEVLDNENVDYELITVDNGSSDNTLELLKNLSKKNSRIKIVRIKDNEGKGWGIINGLKNASGDYVGFMDGDGQVLPGDIISIFKKIKADGLDLCIPKRVVRKENTKRKIASKGYNVLLSLFFLTPLWDMHGNPKIMKRKCYEELDIVSKDWFIDSEILIKMHLNKYKIAEVPVEYKKRAGGESHITLSTILEFLKNLIKWRIILLRKK